MAAFDTPWLDLMSPTPSSRKDDDGGSQHSGDLYPPTVAAFSPVTLSHATSTSKQRSTILVHQKSPLLIATPPQITRALAYSHPFLLPLNRFAGLLTWTSGDPWESFLLVAGFWGIVLYGDIMLRWAGPVVVVMGLILGMYSRRYSPLSSTGLTGEKLKKKHKKADSEITNTKHQKTLDEIVETLRVFTSRCNILLDPLLQLTDFLSTQRTATTATTRPALTILLIRILLVTPVWVFLTIPPIHIITTKRLVLVFGTLVLTWHSRPNRVTRTILWRSALVRQICVVVTGLDFERALAPLSTDGNRKPPLPSRNKENPHQDASLAVSAAAKRRPDAPGVRFTFILYENQRRWVGLGWTTSLFAYERAPWTDEHLNAVPAKEDFELPDVEDGNARWRWAEGGHWLVEGAGEFDEGGVMAKEDSNTDGGSGWIYYDNKWQNGRRGVDGWGRYTRRRKWYRDAELVEITPSTEITPSPTPTRNHSPATMRTHTSAHTDTSLETPPEYAESMHSTNSKKSFRPGSMRRKTPSRGSSVSHAIDDDDRPPSARQADWGIGDDARMALE